MTVVRSKRIRDNSVLLEITLSFETVVREGALRMDRKCPAVVPSEYGEFGFWQSLRFWLVRKLHSLWLLSLKVRRKIPRSAVVAIWWDGRLLLIKNPYLSSYTVPGGVIQKDESFAQGACREVFEEVGILLCQEQLKLIGLANFMA